MTTRREFLRRGALWVAAAAVVEPVARKLWAFPTNPLGSLTIEQWVARTLERDLVYQRRGWVTEQLTADTRTYFRVSLEALRVGGWHDLSAPRVIV